MLLTLPPTVLTANTEPAGSVLSDNILEDNDMFTVTSEPLYVHVASAVMLKLSSIIKKNRFLMIFDDPYQRQIAEVCTIPSFTAARL